MRPSRPFFRRILLVIVLVLVGGGVAYAWGPVGAVLTMDRVDIDLESAREKLAVPPATGPPTTSSGTSTPSRSSSTAVVESNRDPGSPDRSSPSPTQVAGSTPSTTTAPMPSTTTTPTSPATSSTTTVVPTTETQSSATTTPADPTTTTTATTLPKRIGEGRVVVLVGSDARPPYAGARADVIMVAHAPADSDTPLSLISLPRDMAVDVPCLGHVRINAALNGCEERGVGGLELVGVTVEDWTGLKVDRVVAVDFNGFADLIDAVGGYPLQLDHPVRDADAELHLEAGSHRLDGEDTLAWVRSRSTQVYVDGRWVATPTSDLTRTDRQRAVLEYLFGRMKALDDFSRLAGMVESVAGALTIDSDWSLSSIAADVWALRDRRLADGRIATSSYTGEDGRSLLDATESYAEARRRITAREASLG